MLATRRIAVWLAVASAVAVLSGRIQSPAASLPKDEAATDGQFRHGKWPFFPPTRPDVPKVERSDWVRNPVDAFILQKLEAKGLSPSNEAEKLALLRRVTYDLTGLPPTPAEQAAYLADLSASAYENVVDRLLASPHYGERWAQHWLDVVRYAESDGFKEDAHRPNAHKYRDYVIRAFNSDLPYDRFIRQQLAGDELEPDNPEALVATGYCRLYPDEYNAADVRQRRQELLDDVTDTTGLVFLGLTMGCAQCHNHKFDQILQADYYRLQAFFTPMLPRDDLPEATPAQRAEFAKKQAAWDKATADVRAEIEAITGPSIKAARAKALEKFNADIVEAMNTPPAKRTALQEQLVYQASKVTHPMEVAAVGKLSGADKTHYDELQTKLAKFDAIKPVPLPTARGIIDADRPPPPTYRLAAGSLKHPEEKVEPGFPGFLGAAAPDIAPPTGKPQSTGRRSALAAWLTRKDHPLTARIMVNRLWQYHFGQGIVPTPNDFGVAGEPPTHPELLDWLAIEFMDGGWSIKRMQRLMVTSATYRQSAIVDLKNDAHAKALAADPSDKLLWHAHRQRLSGESLRDAVLQVSGELDQRMFGPSVHPELPDGLGNYAWKPDAKVEDRNRRSIYVVAKRNLRLPLLEAFDLPDMHNSCPRRSTTTTAPQALLMLNSDFALNEAQRWATRLLAETTKNGAAADDRAVICAAYEQAYARQPTGAEFDMCAKFISDQAMAIAHSAFNPEPTATASAGRAGSTRTSSTPAHAAAIADFCHAILNSNEFLYVD